MAQRDGSRPSHASRQPMGDKSPFTRRERTYMWHASLAWPGLRHLPAAWGLKAISAVQSGPQSDCQGEITDGTKRLTSSH